MCLVAPMRYLIIGCLILLPLAIPGPSFLQTMLLHLPIHAGHRFVASQGGSETVPDPRELASNLTVHRCAVLRAASDNLLGPTVGINFALISTRDQVSNFRHGDADLFEIPFYRRLGRPCHVCGVPHMQLEFSLEQLPLSDL